MNKMKGERNSAEKSKTKDICVFCGAEATTKDHIPSKGIFPDTKGLELRTVPSCKDCNQGFSEDEVFFRDHVARFSLDKSISAYALFESKIKRSIRSRPLLAKGMFDKMKTVNLKTPSGIYLGKKTLMEISKKDWDRMYNVVSKTVRGLIYIEFGHRLPDEYQLRNSVVRGQLLREKCQNLLQAMRWGPTKYPHIFLHGVARAPESFNSVWITQYFGTVVFITFVVGEELKQYFQKALP